MNTFTIGQSYLAAKIAVIDKMLVKAPSHPSHFNDAWFSAKTALSIVFPHYTSDEVQESLRACFPQLNTRWSR